MGFNSIDCFKSLDTDQQAWLREATTERLISSGEKLVNEGQPSHSMYFVVSGRFSISVSEQSAAIAQIGAGQTIGEIGFLSGDARTATATAIRDSVVLRLARKDYETLCAKVPQLLQDVSRSLAKKLTEATAQYKSSHTALPATIALCPAGESNISANWVEKFTKALSLCSTCIVLTEEHYLNSPVKDETSLTQWLNEQESHYDFVVYLVSNSDDFWASLAMRQSDLVLLIADTTQQTSSSLPTNSVENIRSALSDPPPCWIIFSHGARSDSHGCGVWFDGREIEQLHHVFTEEENSEHNGFQTLSRFLCGRATGLVASGGGAYTAAHIGCFKAFEEAGFKFDIVGGASGGSAMLAAMVSGLNHNELIQRTEQMIVKSGALKKLTIPLYSLLDHTHLDRCLQDNYGNHQIEDNPQRYFAVSTSLSTGEEVLHDRGPFWKAVRASSSIPGLLPPVVAENGELLVDGGILDSVPVKRMKSIKRGPNIILCFQPNHQSRASIEYEKLPGRKALLLNFLRIRSFKSKNAMPGIGSVLTQSMLLNNNSLEEADESDLVLNMTLPSDLKLNDWHRHHEITEIGYQIAKKWLAQQADDPALDAFRQADSKNSPG